MFFEGRTVLLILMSFVATLPSEPFLMYVRIENESRLSISGFSNVTSFACECRQKFSPTAMLGLIKVDETIIIKMDLIVNVNH